MEWIFSSSQLQETPSRRDGFSSDVETQYRKKTAWFIEELGKEMKCGRLVVSTALVLFHRFYSFQSFKQHNRFIIAVTCVFLASKVEEAPKKLREIVTSYFVLRRKFNRSAPTESELKGMPNKILLAERILLQTLGFDLQIVHPYRACLDKIKDSLRLYIPSESRQGFHQNAVNFLNDSYRTTLCLQYNSSQIALAAIFLATIQVNIKPLNPSKFKLKNPVEPSWYELLEPEIDEDSLKSICMQIIDVIDDDSNSNITPTGERKEVAFLTNYIKHSNGEHSLKNKVEHSLAAIDNSQKGQNSSSSKDRNSLSVPSIVDDGFGQNRNSFDDRYNGSQDSYDAGDGQMKRKQAKVSYTPSSSQGTQGTYGNQGIPQGIHGPQGAQGGPEGAPSSFHSTPHFSLQYSATFTSSHPPPRVRQSPSSLASETPPPTPPDTPSSPHHSQSQTPSITPNKPSGADTPDTSRGTPAPPPPPTPTLPPTPTPTTRIAHGQQTAHTAHTSHTLEQQNYNRNNSNINSSHADNSDYNYSDKNKRQRY